MNTFLNITVVCSIGLILGLASCSNAQTPEKRGVTERTDHLLSLDIRDELQVGSLVINDFGDEIGEVMELIYDDYGSHQLIKVEKSYLKYPAAKFRLFLDENGEFCIYAYYP